MSGPKRLSAMISSTAVDLPEHRKQLFDACLRVGIFPIGMEHLPAQDANGIKASLKMVDDADIYIGVYAWRYGWVPDFDNPIGISITEMEFNHALERKLQGKLKEILIFLMHDEHPTLRKDVEADTVAQKKLVAFKDRATTGRIRLIFKSAEELRGMAIHSLGEAEKRIKSTASEISPALDLHPPNLIPRPPEPYIAHPYSLLQTKDVVGRQDELNLLTDWITTNKKVPANTRIFNVVAIGGMGKSALTWKWFNDIVPNEMPKLAGRMWWSFYESDAHWENFIIRALAYVSGESEEMVRKLNPADREDHVFRHLDQKPFLLVLDGLERILLAYSRMDAARMPDDDLDEQTANRVGQAHGLPETAGETIIGRHHLRTTADRRAGQFLHRLARVKQSRILITTRLYPTELQMVTGYPLPGCFAKFLEGLRDDDALNLWREFKVTGSREQLLPLFQSFGNYPLLLCALAGEVAEYHPAPGDFDRWRKDNPDFNPAGLPLKNAKTHVLEYALRGLDGTKRKVLHTLAAFRMPATWDTLRVLLVESKNGSGNASESGEGDVERPTEAPVLKPCSDDCALDAVLTELEDRGLVGWDKPSNRYDLHPIVRGVVWAMLAHDAKQDLYRDLHTFFDAAPRPPDWEKVERLEDLTPAVELFDKLIGLELYETAFVIFRDHLSNATFYRLSANRLRRELLERLFPDGLDSLPRLKQPRHQSYTLNELALAYKFGDEPGQAERLYRRTAEIDRRSNDSSNLVTTLINLADALRLGGKFHASECASRKALEIERKEENSFREGVSLSYACAVLAARGEDVSAKVGLLHATAIFGTHDDKQAWGFAAAELAESYLQCGIPDKALAFAR